MHPYVSAVDQDFHPAPLRNCTAQAGRRVGTLSRQFDSQAETGIRRKTLGANWSTNGVPYKQREWWGEKTGFSFDLGAQKRGGGREASLGFYEV